MTDREKLVELAERREKAEIVEKLLTKGMKQFIRSPLYSSHSHGIAAAWFHDTNWWAGRKAAKLGLAERRKVEPGLFASIPTPLGLAVRAALNKQESGNV